ncbi:MAG: DEAD/DEAH box helicase [Pseudomonadales bacterium]|nr:DEAD/DEAH box helicase [Pseudomonadales bacterium]
MSAERSATHEAAAPEPAPIHQDINPEAPLASFAPAVRDWFVETFGAPTAAQAQAWPRIAAGGHVLVTAPTGSGKTLTAFLWALNAFATGASQPRRTRVLYVSPLKALNNDIRRNLLEPLAALEARGALPALRAETRSGDTSQGDRQRLLRNPPEILITTPESLLLMLSSVRGRLALADVETVIVDEVHALVDNRRGTVLFVALERLERLAGAFQRIVLSATVRPLEAIAAFAAGADPDDRQRPITCVAARADKRIELHVRCPADALDAAARGVKIWEPLAAAFRRHIAANTATLFFVNSRRLAEQLTFRINDGTAGQLAFAHHGSLARELRLAVEQRLKSGALKAIVATSSLEMGIDIGSLDEVVLVQSPPDVAAALQRIGRAGHQVGAVSRASLYPTHPQDFIEAAALAEAVATRDIEPMHLLENPLDVLAQLLVALTASESWRIDDLYRLVCQAGPYRRLPRAHFDLVVDMLAGRYAGGRIRELKPRLRVDRLRGLVTAERSAVLTFHHSGGVIPDRGYFQLRHADTGTAIGELDEEFVWEATVGQTFAFGTQNWQIQRITHNDVLARPTTRPTTAPPFWRSETRSRSDHLSVRIGEFLALAETHLATHDDRALLTELTELRCFEPTAAAALVEYLVRQRAATGAALPHASHLLAESVDTAPGGYRSSGELHQLVLHTFWGGRVNQPLALALRAALEADAAANGTPERIEIAASDNAIVLLSRKSLDAERILELVPAERVVPLLRHALEESGFFGARFREAAGRALLLSRQRFNARLPLWVSRLQSKKLMSSVHDLADFPLLLECWRTCLEDEFDLPALKRRLAALADGTIELTSIRTVSPSPFAAGLAWDQISRYMYADDEPETRGRSALADDLIDTAIGHASLRPAIRQATIEAFLARRQRTAPGYAPESADDWADWIRERVLLSAMPDDGVPGHPDLARLTLDGRTWHVHRELLHGLMTSGWCAGAIFDGAAPPLDDPRTPAQFALEVLSFHGPLDASAIATLLPRVPDDLLDDRDAFVYGALLADEPERLVWCDRQNYEALLRMQRARARPLLEPRPCTALPAFLARWQGLGRDDGEDPASRLVPLSGYRAPVEVWLNDLPAARLMSNDRPATLLPVEFDHALGELGFTWQGAGPGQVRIGDPEDLALLDTPRAESSFATLFTDRAARYAFLQLLDQQPDSRDAFNDRWWRDVWNGGLAADDLKPLREGVARNFELGGAGSGGPPRTRARRPPPAGWSGYWRLVAAPSEPEDALAELEDARERARLLLERYGFVCRELANREGDPVRWAALFRALRLMELAGEVAGGLFFEGLSGPQFVTPAAQRALEASGQDTGPDTGPDFWINAMDPVSPCGLGLPWPTLPQRRPQNYLAFRAGRLALVIENQGRRLRFVEPPEPTALPGLLAPLRHLLARTRRLPIDTIDDAPAHTSERLALLGGIGRIMRDHRQVWLEPL